jgi:hypothetical protein
MRERIHASHLRHLSLHTLNLSSDIFTNLPRLHLPFQRIQSLCQLFDVTLRRPALHGLAGESTLRVRPRA